jgi:hypothetical protein
MPEIATFRLTLRGGLADRHVMEGYDGYTALAGAAFTLSLVTNYVETGRIRHRGEFVGRHAVIAEPMGRGSLIADFKVLLAGDAAKTFNVPEASSINLLYGLVRRVIHRNTGIPSDALNDETQFLLEEFGGDVEALVSATEPSLRRAHDAIGNSASTIDWVGGFSSMGSLNPESKAYMKDSIPDPTLMVRKVSVSGFFGNTGRGLIFDSELGRNISVSMTRETLLNVGTVFSYGLDQYLKKTGNTVTITFTRMLSSDGRPKHYIIKDASVTPQITPSKPM